MSQLTLLVLSCLVGIALGGIPWVGEPRGEEWWMDRHNAYVQNTNINGANISVLFYGDSITEGWGGEGAAVFNQHYAPLGTANYGIGGDRVEHLIWRINQGEIDGMSPKLCVMKIGTNNIGSNSVEDIARGNQEFIKQLQMKLPNMKILLLGVLPRNNAELTGITDGINNILRGYANGNSIQFFDMRDHFYLGNGEFANELYNGDLLHLSAAGYAKWQQVMDPIFTQMLNSF